MIYLDKLFPKWVAGMEIETRNYPYRISQLKKNADANKEQAQEFREAMEGMCVKDASKMVEGLQDGQMGTGLLDGFQPDIYLDPNLYGVRQSIAKRDFPIVPQSSNSSFKHRYMWRSDSVGLYREGEDILSSVSKRLTDEFAFTKIADSMVYTREFLSDSTLDQISLDMAMSQNKIAMFEDRLMWHELFYGSDVSRYPHWNEHNFTQYTATGSDGIPNADDIIDAVSNALMSMTTRPEDNMDLSELRLYMSPAIYKILWDNPDYRRFDILGQTPTQVSGSIPPLFKIPTTVISPGYFNIQNQWVYREYTMFLVGTGSAAIRMRADTRVEPWQIVQRQMEGWLQSERLRPYILNPLRYMRIGFVSDLGSSGSDTLDVASIENVTYKPRDLQKDDANKEEMTIIEAS